MSTPYGMRPETPGRGSWWSRIGTLGQVLTALIGLIAALVPIVATTGLPSQGGGTQLPPAAVTTTTPHKASTTTRYTPPPPTRQADPIHLTISDRLTEGAEAEVIVVTLGGKKVATLTATREDPVVTKRVTATRAGNYSYVASAVIRYYDDDGTAQIAKASGRGSVAIDDGTRLEVYLVEEADGISLTLQSAS